MSLLAPSPVPRKVPHKGTAPKAYKQKEVKYGR